MPRGRPSSYDPEFCKWAQKLTNLGATDREVAEFLEVAESTLYEWKHQHPEFSESLKLGKEEADNRVEQSLYRRATGYSFDAVKIFPPKTWSEGDSVKIGEPVIVPYVEHVPPDTTACIFWLKNRRKKDWRDRHDLGIGDESMSLIDVLGQLAARLPV